jgi:hypothetical protein
MSNDYPAFFFHAHHGRKKVFSQADRDALGPEWADSPTKVHETYAAARAGQPDPETPIGPAPGLEDEPVAADAVDAVASDVAPTDEVPRVPADLDDAAREEIERTALWSAPVGVIVESLSGAPREILERVKAFEEANPKGPRVTVIRACEKALAVPPVEQPPQPAGGDTSE